MTVAERTRRKRQAAKPSSLTVEVALYLIIALMAVGLRLYKLGGRPMQVEEAAQALAAWRFAQGLSPGQPVGQIGPLLFTANMLLFAVFGAGDFLARLVTALSGALLAIGPYFLRRHLGRMGALAASFLLAISPSVLFFSRYLGGEIIVATCALAITIGLFDHLEQRQSRHLYLVAIALALALTAGAGTYTFLFVVVSFVLVLALVNRFLSSSEYWQMVLKAWRAARREKGVLRDSGTLLAVLFALLSTSFLLRFSGLQDAIDLFPAWLSAFPPRVGGHPWYYHLQLLLVYEPLILVFGLAAVVYLLRRRDLFSLFLAYWSGIALLIYFIAGARGPGDVLLIVVPLALLAGAFIGRLLEELVAKASWMWEGLFVVLACPVVVHLGLELGSYASRGTSNYLLLAMVAVFILAGLLILYWVSFGPEPTLRAGGLVLLLVLTLVTVGIGCNLNYRRGSDPHELIMTAPTSRSLFDLVQTLEFVSSRKGDARSIPVTVHQGAGPVLAWYLRDFENIAFVDQLSSSIDTPVVIAPAEEQEPTLGANYSGQDFVLTSSWKLQGLSWSDLLEWLFYRRVRTPVQTTNVILWVKQEQPPEGSE